MASLTETLIKDSNNKISFTLTEDGEPITVSPTDIQLFFFPPYGALRSVLEIARSPDGNGISYSSGVIEINPADLIETLDELLPGVVYRLIIVITTATDTAGVEYGKLDSDDQMYVLVQNAAA